MLSLEDQFSYHPPTTEDRIAAHNTINEAALKFALVVTELIPQDDEYHQKVIDTIQQARMFANQAVTYRHLENNKSQ